jgi:hypothetical protein
MLLVSTSPRLSADQIGQDEGKNNAAAAELGLREDRAGAGADEGRENGAPGELLFD